MLPGFQRPLNRSFFPFQTLWTDTMCCRGIKASFKELFYRHPFIFEMNVVAPTANARETFQVTHMANQPPRRASDQKPDCQRKQHFQRGLMKIRDGMICGKDQ